jgi:hypothetical protein
LRSNGKRVLDPQDVRAHPPLPPLRKGGKYSGGRGTTGQAPNDRRIPAATAEVSPPQPDPNAHPPRRIEITRDTWVSEVGREADGNNGASPRLKLKSIQEMTLLDLDARSLRGRTIRSAELHLKLAGDQPLRRVTISSVGAEWFEGTGSDYAIQPGGVTFRRRRHSDLPWSKGGGDLCHVVLGNGGTIWRMADASAPDQDGWQRIPVDPRIVEARLAGLSHGFLAFDDTGSEWSRSGEAFTFRLFPNRFVYSRDQNRDSGPYFTIELGPDDRQPPRAPSALQLEPESSLLPAGEALVSWVTPRDAGPAGTLGFVVTADGRDLPRELIPMAGPPGQWVEMHLRGLTGIRGRAVKLAVTGVDGAGNHGPPATASIELSERVARELPRPLPAPASPRSLTATSLPRLGTLDVAVLDELDKLHPVTGELIPDEPDGYLALNHLWDAAAPRISLQGARNEYVAFQVLLRGDQAAGTIQPELTFVGAIGKQLAVEFGRYQAVTSKRGPLPDPIVPLGYPERTRVAGTKNQSFHVEIYIPHDLPAGKYEGALTLVLRGSRPATLRLPVLLGVWDFTLPDHLSFLPEMNCYGLPENERDYYRLAHRHRTVLNRVPYNQNGRMQDGCAPGWDSRRGNLDWPAWDRRFGPLLDGSAFADLPRRRVPVDCFYLPLHENWPSPMEGNYNGDYWADHAFPESYRRAFVTAARQIAAHLQSKSWNETLFQCFLNNKNNFKAGGWSRGSSPWLLDEPASFQDYWALRYFARAFHEGINQAVQERTPAQPEAASTSPTRKRVGNLSAAAPRFVFRADISRPQWRRDSLDGLLDYHVVGSAMRKYPYLVSERKRAFGEIVLEYGSTNPVEGSNLQPVGWCLDVWSLGADGVIPWQTIGTPESWERADELALFYPAWGQAGRSSPRAGLPIPSIRLKAYRRGQQDVEYLALWSSSRKEPRWAVGSRVRAALKLAGTRQSTGTTDAEDAGRIDYTRLHSRDVWALRSAIGAALSAAHPAFLTKLVDFRTPRRDPDHVSGAYVGE